jgi:hypothetical protein
LVSEALYDPTSAEPDGEWIELYNAGGSSLDLSGCKVGDEETAGLGEGMYQFPADTWLASGQVIVVANRATAFEAAYGFAPDYELVESDPDVPNLSKYSAWATGSLYLSNTGDEVLVLDVNDQVVDAVSWGSSTWAFSPSVPLVGAGHTIERQPAFQDTDSAADWVDQPVPQPGLVHPPSATPMPTLTATVTITPAETSTPTHTATPTEILTLTPIGTPTQTPTPEQGGLLISEVMYDPSGDDPAGEWIEIYNPTSHSLDLSVYKLGDEETMGGGEGMFQFPAGAELGPGEVIVVANQAIAFEVRWGFKPEYELSASDPAVPDMIKYTPWSTGSLALSNSGDDVLLLDGTDGLVDALSWDNSSWAFEPPAPDVVEDHSLERIPADVDTNSAADWTDQASPQPGLVN